MQVAYQQFYTTIGIEDAWKGLLDSTKNVIDTLNGLPKVFDKVPVNAAAMVYTVITLIKNVALNLFAGIASELNQKFKEAGIEHGESYKEGLTESAESASKSFKDKVSDGIANPKSWSRTLSIVGSLSVTIGALVDKTKEGGRAASALATSFGGVAQAVGGVIQGLATGNWLSAIMPIATGVLNAINGISIGFETSTERLERLTKEVEELNNEAKKAKAEYNTLDRSIKKIEELTLKRNDSIEAAEEYNDAINELSDSFPQLIIGFDEAGNALINIKSAELLLAEARRKTAEATLSAIKQEREKNQQEQQKVRKDVASNVTKAASPFLNELGFNQKVQTTYSFNNLGIPIDNAARTIKEWENQPALLASKRRQEVVREYQEYLENEATDLERMFLEIVSFDENDYAIEENIQKILEFQKRVLQERNEGLTEWEFLFEKQSNDELSFWENAINNIKKIQPLEALNENLSRSEITQTLYSKELLNNDTLLRSLTASLIYSAQEGGREISYEDATDLIVKWWKGLDENQEAAKQIFENLPNYSLDSIYQLLEIDKLDEENQAIVKALEDYYGTQVTDVIDNINEKVKDTVLQSSNLNYFYNPLGQTVLVEGLDLITQYNQQLPDTADILKDNFLLFIQGLNTIATEDANAFTAINKILSQGYSTSEQINTAIASIENLGLGEAAKGIIEYFEQFGEALVSNYLLTLQAAIDTNSQRYTSDQKTLSKLTSGMDFTEVTDFLSSPLAQQDDMTLSLVDFDRDASGAFKLANSKMIEYWRAYVKENYRIADDITQRYEEISKIDLSNEVILNNLSDELKYALTGTTEATAEQLAEAIRNSIESYKLLAWQNEQIQQLLIQQISFDLGDYTSLGLSTEQFAVEIQKGINVKRDNQLLQQAVETATNAINSYLNDAIEKGINKLDTRLYALPSDVPEFIDYTSLVTAYANYFDTQSAEWNALMVAAIQKDNEKVINAAEAMQNVTFISDDIAYASLETAQKLADIFGRNIQELIDLEQYDAVLGGYKVQDLSIFKNIKNAKEMVADSIQSFFEAIVDLLGQGLGGKLDNAGRNNLISDLAKYGIQLTEADFFQTAEGLQLSAMAAMRTYSELKNIDNIRARLVFDELKDSLTKSGEVCENLSSTLAEIARLERELVRPENANNQLLKDRVALYKEIAHSQALDPNEFKFMDRNLPSGMQSPENYWNAVGKAYSAVSKAKTTGYMEIQDYYNIVNEMTSMIELSGGQLEWMGITFENAAEMSATMIEQGMSALTNIDGDGVKISMAELGSKFGIGVDDMSKGFEKGFQEMARAQIKMLDAQINFLEGVVVLQNLNEVAGEDGWQLSDIFEGNDFSSAYTAILELEDISKALQNVEFNETNLYDFLHDYDTMMSYFDGDQNAAYQFILKLLNLANSEEWTTTNLTQLFNTLMEENNLDIKVKLDVDDSEIEAATEPQDVEVTFKPKLPNGKLLNNASYITGVDEINTSTFSTPLPDSDTQKTQIIDVQYSDNTPDGLKELIESIQGIIRTITTDTTELNVPLNVIDDEVLHLVDGKYTIETTDGIINVDIFTDIDSTPLSQSSANSKTYTIDTDTASIMVKAWVNDSDDVLAQVGLLRNKETGKYTLLTETSSIEVDAAVSEKITGLELAKDGSGYILKLSNNASIKISTQVDEENSDGKLIWNDEKGCYQLVLDNNQTIDIQIDSIDTTPLDESIEEWEQKHKLKFTLEEQKAQEEDREYQKERESASDAYVEEGRTYPIEKDIWGQIDDIFDAIENEVFANIKDHEDDTDPLYEVLSILQDFREQVDSAKDSVDTNDSELSKLNDKIALTSETLYANAGQMSNSSNQLKNAIAQSISAIIRKLNELEKFSIPVPGGAVGAKGNVALAAGRRSTLMGELGPELWVSGGHYYVAGQNGAEFVNLPDDAIVFNHLQTQRLLENGTSGRGTPITNERKAISYAKGSLGGGPAKASAAAVLSQLKQIRAMWQSMLDASAKDLGSLAGGSGGGGSGGGGKNWQQKTTTAEIQRWYNLIRQIAKLEKDISYEETLQSKIQSDRIANGRAMYKSYKAELEMLRQEIVANQELAALQRSWYDAKRAELAASDYGRIFTYDENGLQQYTGTGEPGSGLGLDILETLTRRDVYGQAIDNAATAQKQLEYLESISFNIENLKYNDDGTIIDLTGLKDEELDNAYVQMMENFWSNVDGWRDELDSIYDSYHEQLENVLSNQDKQNEVIQKIVDNQLAVENEVLKAIENREQKRIDDAQDMRDALSDSTDKFINGLTDQLNKEREMYNKNQEQDDLNKLRRQLAILQRSGSSSSQIRSLQDQIASKSQDQYFNMQQEQIDSIKQASDAQLERLDHQIDIMTETLEYEKENGLLWQEVYQVMAGTPAQIQDFIINNTPDFQSNSALQVAEDLRELKLEIEEWVEYRKDVEKGQDVVNGDSGWNNYVAATTNSQLYKGIWSDSIAQRAKAEYDRVYAETSDPNKAAAAANAILQEELNKKNMSTSTATANATSASITTATTAKTSSSSGSNNGTKTASSTSLLTIGSSGQSVLVLQGALRDYAISAAGGQYSNALALFPNMASLKLDGQYGSATVAAVKEFQKKMGLSVDGIFGPATRKKLYGYSKGGLVDYTGLAIVHGSETEPESFFNAEHTKLLKEDMLMRKQLMPSLLSTYNNMLQNSTNHGISNSINKNDSLNIEKLELNMSVEHMNNDYDARQAVHTMMDELMSISRKSGNLGIKRG